MYEVLREVALNPKTACLSAGEKNVLTCLAFFTGEEGDVDSLSTICQFTNLSPQQVKVSLEKLITLGFILRLANGHYRLPLNETGHFQPLLQQNGGGQL